MSIEQNRAIDYSFSSLNVQSSSLYSHFISLRLDINRKGYQEEDENQDINERANTINRSLNNRK